MSCNITHILTFLSVALSACGTALLSGELYAQESVLADNAKEYTGKASKGHDEDPIKMKRQEMSLMEDIKVYTERAVKDMVLSRQEAEAMIRFAKDSLPEAPALRVSALQQLRDHIDNLYENLAYSSDGIASADYTYMAKSMLPQTLKEPEGFIDPYQRRKQAEMRAVAVTKQMAAMHLSQEKSHIPKWAVWPLRLLFNNGMDTSGKTVSVHGGLYYVPVPPGKPQVSRPWTSTIPKAYDD